MNPEIPDFNQIPSSEISNIRDIADEDWIKYVTLLKTVDSRSKLFRHFMLRDDARSLPCGSLYDELGHSLRIAQIMNTHELSQLKNPPLIAEYFFQETPLFVQVELIDKFPQEFNKFIPMVRDRLDTVFQLMDKNPQLRQARDTILSFAPVLPYDRRNTVLSAFGHYIDKQLAAQSNDRFGHIGVQLMTTLANQREKELTAFEERDIIDEKSLFQSSPEHTVEVLRDFLGQLLTDGTNVYANELVDQFKDELIQPILFSALYKRMSRSWNQFMESSYSSDQLVEFMSRTAKEHLVEYYSDFLERFPDLIQLADHFSTVATVFPQLEYFKTRDSNGNRQYLFFHQVEAYWKISQFEEGAMLTDDPGLGKTIMLALTAIERLKMQEPSLQNPRRILVVGNKSVLATWEREVRQRLHMLPIEQINPTIYIDTSQRVTKIKKFIENPQQPIQIVEVNIDMFRNPKFREFMDQEDCFDILIIDEAHHIKSKDPSLLKPSIDLMNLNFGIAERTASIYKFAKEHLITIYLATATPFVLDENEPLALAHLISPDAFNAERISQLKQSSEFVFDALRSCVVRRKKSEVADLPSRSAQIYQLDIRKMDQFRQQYFLRRAEEIARTTDNTFAHFYEMLGLESELKQEWLINKVRALTSEGKKVVIFTPFVNSERHSGQMSTVNLSQILTAAGIDNVGILDGTLNQEEVEEIKNRFHLPVSTDRSLSVLIGNYKTAGESITLSSPDNNATEVILFVAPDTAARLLQAIDRIHRFGQTHDVHIHIPMVLGDLLNREKGTYDERIIKRLLSRVKKYQAIVDAVFYVEPSNIFQSIILEIKFGEQNSRKDSNDQKININPDTKRTIEWISHLIHQNPQSEKIYYELMKNSVPSLSDKQQFYAFQNIFLKKSPWQIHKEYFKTGDTNIVVKGIVEAKLKLWELLGEEFFDECVDTQYPALSVQRIRDIYTHYIREKGNNNRFSVVENFFGFEGKKGAFDCYALANETTYKDMTWIKRDLKRALLILEQYAEVIHYDSLQN